MKVPFLDLKAQYESIKGEINDAIQNVLESCAFAGGPFVEAFEKNFAEFCRCNNCIGVGSGTEALWIALLALGVGPGDEVITTPNSFIATAEAISFCGATPVFVDVDENTYTLDPQKLADYLEVNDRNSKTQNRKKAIIPVHMFGQMADMDPIMEIAKQHNMAVIEDACQAHGAEYKGRKSGTIGDIGCFSFYPGKNLGAYGEGGAVVTNSSDLAGKCALMRDHGQSHKYHHQIIGCNGRMDGIQGAVLNIKLKSLQDWNEKRRQHAGLYNEKLTGISGISTPVEASYCKHVYHIYAIRLRNRDAMINSLAQKGIFCGIHYPVPIHLQDAYEFLGLSEGSFPIAENCASQYLSLPMFPELTAEQIEYVASEIKKITE